MRHPFRIAPQFMIAVFLLASIVLLYARVGNFSFISFDDDSYIYNNPTIQNGLTTDGIYWAFSTFQVANWHPLTWLSHMLDVSLFGMDAGSQHLVNVAFHAVNSLLLFHLLLRMTGAVGRSGFVSALFALHPLHVESVAWLSERKDLLSGLFFLLAISAYLRYVERPGYRRYIPMATLFALSLLSKPMAVTLPFVLLVLDWWPLNRIPNLDAGGPIPEKHKPNPTTVRILLSEKIPLIVFSIASCAITVIAQRTGETVVSLDDISLGWRLANALSSYGAYLIGTVWPFSLCYYYPHPGASLPIGNIVISILLLAAISAYAVRERVRRPWIVVGWSWFLGMLIPVIGLVQVGGQARADRYTYLPLIGLFLIVAWGGEEVLRRAKMPKAAIVIVSSIVLIAIASVAWVQVGYWRDSRTLYSRALQVTENNWIAHKSLGGALLEEGNNAEALANFEEALKIRPDNAEAHTNAGCALLRLGKTDEAISHLREALRIWPDDYLAWFNLVDAFNLQGKPEQAAASYRQVLRIRLLSPEVQSRVDEILARRGENPGTSGPP